MPEAANPQPPAHLRSPHGAASVHFDALRGVAAVGVCLSHLRDIFFRDYSQLEHHSSLLALGHLATGLGHQWVIIFFVLSGNLVGGSVLRAHATGRWAWSGYLFNRLTRLYIVLIPALVLGGVLDTAGLHLFGAAGIYGGGAGSHTITFAVKDRLNLTTLIGNYAFLQTIFVPTLGSNGPLWSLTNEFWYYIAFPALVLCFLPKATLGRRIFHLLLLVAVLVLVKWQIALLGLVWLMGMAIHYLPRIPPQRLIVRRLMIWFALAAFAATLAWCKRSESTFGDYFLGAVVTLLIYILLSCSHTPALNFYRRAAERLSHSSYTLYLVHVPLLIFIAALLESRFRLKRWDPDTHHLLFAAGIFVVVMLYAQLVWFFFEKRTDDTRGWLKRRMRRESSKAQVFFGPTR
jgi:peptidoglycan/LPS O-acetylase OafA/YrhL